MTFSWDHLAAPRPRLGMPRRHARARLALVTPWLPEQSGVADYSRRLVRELARSIDVDVIVAGAPADYPPPPPGVRLLSAAKPSRAGATPAPPDRILYCMGNSSFHEHVYELLRERPGAVMLHDVQLTGFYGFYAGRERPDDPLARLMERVEGQYGSRVPQDELSSAPLQLRRRVELGIYLTGEVQRLAERIFVHSRYALGLLERDVAAGVPRAPVSVMPFGMPDVAASSPRPASSAAPLVVHMGVVSEVKGIATLIRAFGLFAGSRPGARLVIAGPLAADEQTSWSAFAREHAPGARVELPGHLEPEPYDELLRRADLAVQLRTASNGEASGAVCDCLAAGVPTIVTALGWMSELPQSAVVHVPVDADPALLAARMAELTGEGPERTAISTGAIAFASRRSFAHVAQAYLDVLGLR